jgi:CubicO group peptidase (beta-lactamase class C family)
MRRRHFCALTGLTGLTLGTGATRALGQSPPASAPSAPQRPSRQPLRPQPEPPALASALRERARLEGMGYIAALIGADGVRFVSAGRRSAADAQAPDATAKFDYGSISKTFTALLLADMERRGELALTDAVEDVLGQRLRDSTGTPLRWLDLATHRSGLPRLPSNLEPRNPADPYADYDVARLQAFIAQWKPDVPRQARWAYSNLGFGLLGHALAQRAGMPYARLIAERVLRPLGMDDVRVAAAGAADMGLLPGHDTQRQVVPHWTFDVLAGAGALVGSAHSLARYAQAALGLVPTPLAASFQRCLERHAGGAGPGQAMGLGWLLGSFEGGPLANHDGGTAGFSSSLFLDPQDVRATLVMANASVPVTDLALHALDTRAPLRDVAAEQQQTQRPAVTLPAGQLAVLAGSYALNAQFKLKVSAREGRLFAQATGQGEFELFAIDARRFFARVTPLELQFEGDAGEAPALVLHQAGRELRFVRE